MRHGNNTPVRALLVGSGEARLWSMSAAQRMRRLLARAGIETEPAAPGAHGAVNLVLRSDFVIAESLLGALLAAPDTLLVAPDAQGHLVAVAAYGTAPLEPWLVEQMAAGAPFDSAHRPAGLRILRAGELGDAYDTNLRKRATPYALHLTAAGRADVEWVTFREAYKGATDFVTKFVWPLPAFHVTRWCAAARISPNSVTSAGLVLAVLAAWFFYEGWYGVAIVSGWAMTFLDTVDGKLARCTLTSSKWGNLYDHGIDQVHPPLWWLAWWAGLPQPDAGLLAAPLWVALWVILAGYLLQRLIELAFRLRFDFQIHIWRRADSFFRVITARRNPNFAILTFATMLGHPAEGFILVAGWVAVSLLFHAVRLAQALALRARGGTVTSWLWGNG